jgi:hypothetical protein
LPPDQLRHAEVGNLDPTPSVQQQFLRLDVAMEDSFVVGELQRLADLRDKREGLLEGESASVQRLRRFLRPQTP